MSRQPNFASLVQPMLPQRDGGGGGGGAIIAAAAAADGAAIRTGMSNAEHVDPTPRRVDDHIVVALDPNILHIDSAAHLRGEVGSSSWRSSDKTLPFMAALPVKCPTPMPLERSVKETIVKGATKQRFEEAVQEKAAGIEERLRRAYEKIEATAGATQAWTRWTDV